MSLFGRVIPAAVGLGSVCLYTRLLDPASVGIYALLLSSSLLASGLGFAWLRNAVLRVMSGEAEGRMDAHIARTVVVSFVVTALVVGVLEGAFLHVFRPGIPLLSVVLAVGAALASAWNDLNASLLQAKLLSLLGHPQFRTRARRARCDARAREVRVENRRAPDRFYRW